MITKETILAFLKENKEQIFTEFNLVKIGIFGSFARNQQTESSDIDIILEFEPATKNLNEKKSKLRALIGNRFNRKVDLCREKYIKPYFKKEILDNAIYA